MQLQPCPACKRHVAIEATSCPFCATSVSPRAPIAEPSARMCRAAVFMAGALAASTTACWTNKSEPKHVEQTAATPADAATAVTPDAAVVQTQPDPDLDDRHFQNHPCVQTDKGLVCAPYGAPAARRRVV